MAIGVGDHYRAFRFLRGINVQGFAEIFAEDTQEYAYAMKLFSPIFKSMEKKTGIPIQFPRGMTRIIRVTPTKMVYYYNKKGIVNAHWEAK